MEEEGIRRQEGWEGEINAWLAAWSTRDQSGKKQKCRRQSSSLSSLLIHPSSKLIILYFSLWFSTSSPFMTGIFWFWKGWNDQRIQIFHLSERSFVQKYESNYVVGFLSIINRGFSLTMTESMWWWETKIFLSMDVTTDIPVSREWSVSDSCMFFLDNFYIIWSEYKSVLI